MGRMEAFDEPPVRGIEDPIPREGPPQDRDPLTWISFDIGTKRVSFRAGELRKVKDGMYEFTDESDYSGVLEWGRPPPSGLLSKVKAAADGEDISGYNPVGNENAVDNTDPDAPWSRGE